MNRDSNHNIIQDPPSNDGGDSLNRDAQFIILELLNFNLDPNPGFLKYSHREILRSHLVRDGASFVWTRNKTQEPWNNPKNCTRDQIGPAVIAAGMLDREKFLNVLQDTWYGIISRGFKYQNVERDFPGTRKSLLPLFYKKGDRIDDKRHAEIDGWLWEPNAADLCGPTDFGVFIRAFNSKIFYPVLLLVDIFTFISVLAHCLVYARDPDRVDDMQLLMILIQNKLVMPTPFSWLARIVYFVLRPKNLGNEEYIDSVTLNKKRLLPGNEINDPVMGAIAWYFRPPNVYKKEGYDSPEFVDLWRPVIAWLRR